MDQPDARSTDIAPPYFPFRSLTNLLVRMETEGIPRRLDRGYLSNMAGGTIAPFLTGLRSLGLIDEEERPLASLVELVKAGENRPQDISALIRERYPWAVDLGEAKATHQELEEAFRARGPSGSTLRKAIAFYLGAARYAGIPLSPFFKETRPSGDEGARKSAVRRRPRDHTSLSSKPTLPPNLRPANDLATMRREYFDLLRKKAEAAEQPDTDLFDRIERLIGVLGDDSPVRHAAPQASEEKGSGPDK